MKLHPTRLEDLPNEILLHIIECSGSPADIYRSFHGLNRRFYHLIHRVQLSLDVYCEDKEYSFLTEYFSWNFQRLCIFSLCPSIRLDRFVHLRSLTITEPTDNQIHSIQSRTLPELEYLCSPASMNIFDCLFGAMQDQWTNLRSCHFHFCHVPQIKLTWKINSVLRTLSGVICSRLILSKLLSLLPNLRYLRVDMVPNDHSHWNSSIFARTLSTLHIGFERLIPEDLCRLIGSNLSHLFVEISHDQMPIDFPLLGNALLFSLSKPISTFQLNYRGRKLCVESVRTSHPLFRNIQSIGYTSYDTHGLICHQMF